jgi:hypothetical protein
MQRLKVIVLALLAVFAMSAVVASSAFAEGTEDEFEFTGTAATWTGTNPAGNNHVFEGNAGTVSCSKDEFKGEVPTGRKATTVNANVIKYENCTAFGFIGAKVTVTNCEYHFHGAGAVGKGPTDLEPESTDKKHESQIDLDSVVGKVCSITISVSGTNCVITFKPQTNLSKITYFNKTATELEIEAAVTGIAYTQTGSQCTGGTGNFTNGKYSGKVVVKEATIN